MTPRCARCKQRPEYRKGRKTGGKVDVYRKFRAAINSSLVLNIPHPSELCIPCMQQVLLWVDIKNTPA